MIVNSSTNINETNNHHSPPTIEHKKQDNIILCWKSRSGVGQAQEYGRVKPINGIPTFPL
jgi:hypothetical protein